MFTLYIHCLEVLAMKAEGQTVKTIVEMGCEWTRQKVSAALYELEQEGYVTRDTSGKTHVWQIKEKACEYCERIARLYNASHVIDEIADYVASAEMVAQEAPKDAPPSNDSVPENVVTVDTKQGVVGVPEKPPSLNHAWHIKDRDNEGNYYTQITGRCEACDEFVEHHYALCDTHLSEEINRIGEDAYAIYGLESGTIPHLVQRAIEELPSDYQSGDIPF